LETERERIEDGELEPAGFWIRFFAHLLDILILVTLVNIVYLLDRYGASRGFWEPMQVTGSAGMTRGVDFITLVRSMFYLGIYPVYYITFHYLGGQTPGKRAFSIRVVDLDGSDITLFQSAVRWVGYLVCDFTFGLGYLMIPFSRLKRGLHDMMARTRVVYWT